MPIPLWSKWLGLIVFSGVLGASVMMLAKGTLPPPFKTKVPPLFSTVVFVIGMTGLLVFGDPDLLQNTINLLTGH